MRKAAASALGQLGKHAASGLPAITKYLEHKDPDVGKAAGSALGQIGKHAVSHVPAVSEDCLRDPNV